MNAQAPTSDPVTSNLVPVEWLTVARFACGEARARCDVLVKRGHRGSPMALHSEVPDTIIEGPDGPAHLASEFWTQAQEHRAKGDEAGRYFFMLSVHVEGTEEPEETGWHEIKSDQVSELADSAMGDSGAAFAWKCNAQLHNVLMRNHHATATILERLGHAGQQQIAAVQTAMTATTEGARMAIEAEKGEYDLRREEMELREYGRMFQEWMGHMQQSKAMNTDGPTITAPTDPSDAAGALHDSLTLGQSRQLHAILGDELAHDTLAGLVAASTAKGPEEAAAIVRTILTKLMPHQAKLGPLFAPPHVPPNIGAFQNACLATLARVAQGD